MTPRLRQRPPPPPRLGHRIRYPPRPRPYHPTDHMARRRTPTHPGRDRHHRPRRRLRPIRHRPSQRTPSRRRRLLRQPGRAEVKSHGCSSPYSEGTWFGGAGPYELSTRVTGRLLASYRVAVVDGGVGELARCVAVVAASVVNRRDDQALRWDTRTGRDIDASNELS